MKRCEYKGGLRWVAWRLDGGDGVNGVEGWYRN